MATDEVLAHEVTKIRRALLELEGLMAGADPEQRERIEEIRLTLKLALEAAPSSCACAISPSRTCSLTVIREDDL